MKQSKVQVVVELRSLHREVLVLPIDEYKNRGWYVSDLEEKETGVVSEVFLRRLRRKERRGNYPKLSDYRKEKLKSIFPESYPRASRCGWSYEQATKIRFGARKLTRFYPRKWIDDSSFFCWKVLASTFIVPGEDALVNLMRGLEGMNGKVDFSIMIGQLPGSGPHFVHSV